ncbi:unnamed protein product, partial [Didymodactylos carnosus]
MEGRQKTRRD